MDVRMDLAGPSMWHHVPNKHWIFARRFNIIYTIKPEERKIWIQSQDYGQPQLENYVKSKMFADNS